MRGFLGRLGEGGRVWTDMQYRESVVENLRDLLGSNVGGSPSAASYGIDFGQFVRGSTKDSSLCDELERAIKDFEPRVEHVIVGIARRQALVVEFTLAVTLRGRAEVDERFVVAMTAGRLHSFKAA